jgi:hypothetical protein
MRDTENELFIEKCKNIDFSAGSVNKAANLERLKKKFTEGQEEGEKEMRKIKIPFIAAAMAVLLLGVSITAYGRDAYRVIQSIFVNDFMKISIIEYDGPQPVPVELSGKLYNKDGVLITEYTSDDVFYNAYGEEIKLIIEHGETGIVKAEIILADAYELYPAENGGSIFTDWDEGVNYFICDIARPGYLPAGYRFDRLRYYGSAADLASEKYMTVFYTDGTNELLCMLRYMDETTAIEYGYTRTMEINGHFTSIGEGPSRVGNTLDIFIGDVMYSFFTTLYVDMDELMKIAESLG